MLTHIGPIYKMMIYVVGLRRRYANKADAGYAEGSSTEANPGTVFQKCSLARDVIMSSLPIGPALQYFEKCCQ